MPAIVKGYDSRSMLQSWCIQDLGAGVNLLCSQFICTFPFVLDYSRKAISFDKMSNLTISKQQQHLFSLPRTKVKCINLSVLLIFLAGVILE